MEAKKNPKLDPNRNSMLHFLMGTSVILLLVLLALEWKSHPEASDWELGHIDPDLLIEVEPPITIHKLPEPPKVQIQAPPIIEVVPDDREIVETVIASNEPDQSTEITPIENIEVDEGITEESVPFILIENAPLFPGCEKQRTEEDKRECFQEMLQKHIQKHFKYPELAQELGLEGRVNTMFTIMEDGSVSQVQMRGPHESLEAESARILSKLPKMIPGKQRGRTVKVSYSIPITFKLQ